MNTLNPLQKSSAAFPLTVPGSFRAWAAWANLQGCGCLQVHTVATAFADRHGEQDALRVALCEVYSRAVNECAIGLHFDRVDTTADAHVAAQIAAMFSWDVAELVHSQVGAAGPVVRPWADVTRLAREAESALANQAPALASPRR